MKIKRFGISLEEGLLKSLDNLVKAHHFPNRSQAVRFLIRNNLVEKNFKDNGRVCGCIVLVYDHHKRDLLNKSTDIQHDYQNLIISTQPNHLDHRNCLEVITVKGRAKQLQELADKLISLKGVKHGKLVVTGAGEE